MFWFLAARVEKFLNELLEKQAIVLFTLIYILTVSFALRMLIATASYILQGFFIKVKRLNCDYSESARLLMLFSLTSCFYRFFLELNVIREVQANYDFLHIFWGSLA